MIESVEAERFLAGRRLACSRDAGWQGLLVRTFADPPRVEEINTAATNDLLIVMNTGRSFAMEAMHKGRWLKAAYRPGTIGITAPGVSSRLRWSAKGPAEIGSTHVHLPTSSIRQFFEEEADARFDLNRLPDALSIADPVMEATLRGLTMALAEGAGPLYAEAATQFLCAHLAHTHMRQVVTNRMVRRNVRGLDRARSFMLEDFARPLTLEEISRHAGVSRFHFLRTFSAEYGCTPMAFLAAARVEKAKRLLAVDTVSAIEASIACGFSSASQFSTTFKRVTGQTPSQYRQSLARR